MIILYVDPGTGALIINLIIALFGTLFFYFKSFIFWFLNIRSDTRKIAQINRISVFSEGENYWSTFSPIVNSFIENKIYFQYFTMSYKDPALMIESEFMDSKYIGKSSLAYYKFSKINSENLIATTPNIGNKGYPLKKPKNVKNLIHVFHSIVGVAHYRIGSLDNYDTVFVGGNFQADAIKELENIRGLKEKKIFNLGIPYFNCLMKMRDKYPVERNTILIASSWGEKSCFRKYGYKFIDNLFKENYKIIIRPHPHSYIYEPEFIKEIKNYFSKKENIKWDESISPLKSMCKSNILISDSSSIRYDYSFIFERPVITLKVYSTQMKGFENEILNFDWENKTEKQIGLVINSEHINKINQFVKKLIDNHDKNKIKELRHKTLGNITSPYNSISEFFTKNNMYV